MKYFEVRFSLHSSIVTPFQSDIIFGHLAWAWRYIRGEDAMKELLASLESAPVLITDAFPVGKMPRPVLSPVSSDGQLEMAINLAESGGKPGKAGVTGMLRDFKKLKSVRFISTDKLDGVRFRLSNRSLMNAMLSENAIDKSQAVHEVIGHNTINRLTGTVSQSGGFHPHLETFYQPGKQFWCRISEGYWSQHDIAELWEYIENSGYGADSSTGKGRIKIEEIITGEIDQTVEHNAVMSLSTFIPSENTTTDAWYETIVKFGRLGSMYANRPEFYKSALVMMKPGGILREKWDNSKIFGTIIKNINPDPDIVQYAHMFPYPVKIAEDN